MGLEKKQHDWVAAKGPVGIAEHDAYAPRPMDTAAALELIMADPVLSRDDYAKSVVRNEGVVYIKETREQVVVDLGNFLAARKAFLEQNKVRSVDAIASQIAEGGPDLADVLDSITKH